MSFKSFNSSQFSSIFPSFLKSPSLTNLVYSLSICLVLICSVQVQSSYSIRLKDNNQKQQATGDKSSRRLNSGVGHRNSHRQHSLSPFNPTIRYFGGPSAISSGKRRQNYYGEDEYISEPLSRTPSQGSMSAATNYFNQLTGAILPRSSRHPTTSNEGDYQQEDEFFQRPLAPNDRRYDMEEDEQKYHYEKNHVEHAAGKEIGYAYPILVALLILGALFVPFISLFFFLAVSAFNCNGIGAGSFASLTPIYGRRRRRKRSYEILGLSNSGDSNVTQSLNDATTKGNRDESKSSIEYLVTSVLPAMMLYDSLEDFGILPADTNHGGRRFGGNTSSDPMATLSTSSALSDYEFWRRQLALSTVRLRDSLIQFGAWMTDSDS